jgi:hypothetical protein
MRDLYDEILEYKGCDLFKKVLIPWEEKNHYKNYLSSLRIVRGISQDDNWELYAFSRVLDLLTLRLQPDKNADGSSWLGPEISMTEYLEFIDLLGLEAKYQEDFNPFYCEIFEARVGSDNFKIEKSLFPVIKLKNLVLKRCGIQITVNPKDNNLALINNAKIYWTFRRKNRKYQDLSHGWASNSQWRTGFRIDLETDEKYIYNHHGKYSLNDLTKELVEELKRQNLELNEAIELIRNRQFIECTKDDSDLFPYDFRYEESKKAMHINHAGRV